jgi:hypothetical protein
VKVDDAYEALKATEHELHDTISSLYTPMHYIGPESHHDTWKKKELKYMFLTGNLHFTPRKMVNSG